MSLGHLESLENYRILATRFRSIEAAISMDSFGRQSELQREPCARDKIPIVAEQSTEYLDGM